MSNQGSPAILHRYQHYDSLSFSSYEDSFLHLLQEITRLQWVQESLPSHNKFYEELRQKETKIKNAMERQSSTRDRGCNVAADMQMQEKLERIQEQIVEAESMLDDLMTHKIRLDAVCDDLHTLYNEVVPAISDNPFFANEQTLEREVAHLAHLIPKIEVDIREYKLAQKELHQARECLDKAINLLPGASTFLDRKALESCGIGSSRDAFRSQSMGTVLEASSPTTHEVEELYKEARRHLVTASKVCKEVSKLKVSLIDHDMHSGSHESLLTSIDSLVVSAVLTVCSTSKLEIENFLRTRINPHFSQLQTQLTVSRYHYEQKSIEWTLQQITILESVLRENGALKNNSLQHEMAVLRMGSNAAIMAIASQASSRVTVDDVLEVNSSETNTDRIEPLPVYSKDAEQPISPTTEQGTVASSPTSPGYSSSTHRDTASNNNYSELPAYSNSSEYDEHDQPPAYSI
ncbi:hypothetical protein BX666DRAFT_244002 [Dichotomocladium elegans]|nr:hypothetical protein BX666DRAFT_244002 [Dichotomocladium elegans]